MLKLLVARCCRRLEGRSVMENCGSPTTLLTVQTSHLLLRDEPIHHHRESTWARLGVGTSSLAAVVLNRHHMKDWHDVEDLDWLSPD